VSVVAHQETIAEFQEETEIMTKLFTRTSLPTFKPDTQGYMLPAPGAPVAVCIAPNGAVIKRPAGWGAGQALKIEKGTHHIAQDSAGDSYPNLEFGLFYEIGEPLDPATDSRAAFLCGFWSSAAPEADIEIRLAQKTRRANVLGEVTDECVGAVFENHEGKTELVAGSRILQSPDDPNVVWAVTPKVWQKKYAEQGKIFTENS